MIDVNLRKHVSGCKVRSFLKTTSLVAVPPTGSVIYDDGLLHSVLTVEFHTGKPFVEILLVGYETWNQTTHDAECEILMKAGWHEPGDT